MTVFDLPTAGAAGPDLARRVHDWWAEAAARAGVRMTGFDPAAPFASREAWARAAGLSLATILSRFSTQMQHSTDAQVRECVDWAARNGLYSPPELVCVDEGITGRKTDRAGLSRAKAVLDGRLAGVLLVFKLSRLFRLAHMGYQFFQEYADVPGFRGVAVTQNIDTADDRSWKPLAYLYGMLDDLTLTAIGDHVRSGLKDLFKDGFTTGALPVGYRRADVPGGLPTRLGRPRTMPAVDGDVAGLIRTHYEMVRDGIPLRQCWLAWVRAGGPCDPRSRTRRMTYPAYRRMLANPRYTGFWAFGRRKNVWSQKKQYSRQVPQKDTEVAIRRCEELRIVPDDLFAAVQARLARLTVGPRGPTRRTDPELWDLVTGCFRCSHCDARFYQAGAGGKGMRCKNGDLCRAPSAVNRKDAVTAVCRSLARLAAARAGLLDAVADRAAEVVDRANDDAKIAALEQAEVRLKNKVNDLAELAGEGTDEDRAGLKARVRAVRAELAGVRADLAAARAGSAANAPPSAADLRSAAADLEALMIDGAAGRLGADVVHRTAELFRRLVGGAVRVFVESRPGKKHTVVRGEYVPNWPGPPEPGESGPAVESVWLRPPPLVDRIAGRVRELIDVDRMTYPEAAAALTAAGERVTVANVWVAHRRAYQLLGEPFPERSYNNGRPRRPRT